MLDGAPECSTPDNSFSKDEIYDGLFLAFPALEDIMARYKLQTAW